MLFVLTNVMMVATEGKSRVTDSSDQKLDYALQLIQSLHGPWLSKAIRYLEESVKDLRERDNGPMSVCAALRTTAWDSNAQQNLPPSTERPISAITTTSTSPITLPQGDKFPASSESTLQILTWNPAIEYKTQPPASKDPPWLSRTESFFKDLPTSEEQWVQKREVASLSTAEHIILAIDNIKSSRLRISEVPRETRCDELHQVLCTFGEQVRKMIVGSKFAETISNYSSLVFIAACCVALKNGHPTDLVDAAQNSFYQVKREGSSQKHHLAADRSAVLWLIQEMERQYHRGLKHRAFEMFLLGEKLLF